MNNYPQILIDTGILVAFYDRKDEYHQQSLSFFSNCTSQLITTIACVTEVMWLLAPNTKVQNEFLSALSKRAFLCEHLLPSDYQRIQELNSTYQDLPADFTDLSLIAISERLNISAIVTLDKDFNIYRRYRKQPFDRLFLS
jgi:predicted nucleic acid-binding protein